MRHIHVPNQHGPRWGLGLAPGKVVVPASGVAVYANTGPATAPLAWSGGTIPGAGGWSVAIPPNVSKLTPDYESLVDLITGDCSDLHRMGLTPQGVATKFGISDHDLQTLESYASSIGMPCSATAAPGVLTQPQLQQVIASSPPAASQVVPTWAETLSAATGSGPVTTGSSGTTIALSVPSSSNMFIWLAAAGVAAYLLWGK